MCYDINGYTGTINRLFMRQTEKGDQGIQEFQNGDIYQGEFLNDMMHGFGTYTCKNGTVIQGQFYKNKFTGNGTITYNHKEKNQTICQMKLEKDQKNGKCFIEFQNGDYFDGKINNNEMTNGTYINNNGDMYYGDISQNMMNGYGYFTSQDCSAKGYFVDGFLTKGEIIDKRNICKVKYNGELLNGLCNGQGKSKLFFNRKLLKSLNGQFKNGKYVSDNKINQKKQKSQKQTR